VKGSATSANIPPAPIQQRARISGAPLLLLLGLHKPLQRAAQKARETVRKRHEAKAAALMDKKMNVNENIISTIDDIQKKSDVIDDIQKKSDVDKSTSDKSHVEPPSENNERMSPNEEYNAATRIQSVARGRQVRKSLILGSVDTTPVEITTLEITTIDNTTVENTTTENISGGFLDIPLESISMPLQEKAPLNLESTSKSINSSVIHDNEIVVPSSPIQSQSINTDKDGAATRIQSVARGRQVRKSLAGERSSQIQQHFATPTVSSSSKVSPPPKKYAEYNERVTKEETIVNVPSAIPATPLRQNSSIISENKQKSPLQVDLESQPPLSQTLESIPTSSVSEKRQNQILLVTTSDALSTDSGQTIHHRRSIQQDIVSPSSIVSSLGSNVDHAAEHSQFVGIATPAAAFSLHTQSFTSTSQSPSQKQQPSNIVTKLLNSPPPARGASVPSQIISSLRDAESKIEELKIELRVKEKMILELNTRCVRLSLKIAGHGEHKESMMATVEQSKLEAAQAVIDRDRMLKEKIAMEAMIQSIRDEVDFNKGLVLDHEIALAGRDKELFDRENRILMMVQALAQRDEEIRTLRKDMEESRNLADARSGLNSAIARANEAETALSVMNDRFQALVLENNELRTTLGVVQMAKTSTETMASRLHSQLTDVIEKNKKLQHSKSLAERKAEALVRYVRENVMPESISATSSSSSSSSMIVDREESTSRVGGISVTEGGDDVLKQARIEIARKSKRIESLAARVSELEIKVTTAEEAASEYSEKAEKATYIAKAAEKRASALGDVLKRLKAAGVEVGEQDHMAISKDNSIGGNRSVVRMLTTNKGRKDSPTTSKILSPAGSGSAAVRSKGTSRPVSVLTPVSSSDIVTDKDQDIVTDKDQDIVTDKDQEIIVSNDSLLISLSDSVNETTIETSNLEHEIVSTDGIPMNTDDNKLEFEGMNNEIKQEVVDDKVENNYPSKVLNSESIESKVEEKEIVQVEA
jgi:hypothetical protein